MNDKELVAFDAFLKSVANRPEFEILKTNDTDIYCSKDCYSEFVDEMGRGMQDAAPEIMGCSSDMILDGNPEFRELIDLNARLRKLPKRMAMLNAHGDSERGEWVYFLDDGAAHSTQKWINRNQLRYSTLFLICCNPGKHEITTRGAAVIAPNGDYCESAGGGLEGAQCELYLPEFGRVESYSADNVLKELKARVARADETRGERK